MNRRKKGTVTLLTQRIAAIFPAQCGCGTVYIAKELVLKLENRCAFVVCVSFWTNFVKNHLCGCYSFLRWLTSSKKWQSARWQRYRRSEQPWLFYSNHIYEFWLFPGQELMRESPQKQFTVGAIWVRYHTISALYRSPISAQYRNDKAGRYRANIAGSMSARYPLTILYRYHM